MVAILSSPHTEDAAFCLIWQLFEGFADSSAMFIVLIDHVDRVDRTDSIDLMYRLVSVDCVLRSTYSLGRCLPFARQAPNPGFGSWFSGGTEVNHSYKCTECRIIIDTLTVICCMLPFFNALFFLQRHWSSTTADPYKGVKGDA